MEFWFCSYRFLFSFTRAEEPITLFYTHRKWTIGKIIIPNFDSGTGGALEIFSQQELVRAKEETTTE